MSLRTGSGGVSVKCGRGTGSQPSIGLTAGSPVSALRASVVQATLASMDSIPVGWFNVLILTLYHLYNSKSSYLRLFSDFSGFSTLLLKVADVGF